MALSGDPNSYTSGVVSATDVVVSSSGVTMANVFATTAEPPLDNAGAPVIDNHAQVAGILLPQGLGAVPIDYARHRRRLDPQLRLGRARVDRRGGHELPVRRAGDPTRDEWWTGVSRGMQRGDVVMSVNGRTVNTADQLRADVRDHWPSQMLKFVVSRSRYVAAARRDGRSAPTPPEQPDRVHRPPPKVTTTTTQAIAYSS